MIVMGLSIYFLVDISIIKNISKRSQFAKKGNAGSITEFRLFVFDKRIYHDELAALVDAINQGKRNSIELLSERNKYNEKIEHQLNHDVLTGLPTRRKFESHLSEKTRSYEKNSGTLDIYFVDIDDFKLINDSVGYSGGDRLLKKSAERLQKVFNRDNAYLARLGGDEFVGCILSK